MRTYLISAYKRQIERRQNQLSALPKPLEEAPIPGAPPGLEPITRRARWMPSASFWRRLGAMLYDSLLILALWLTTLYFLVALNNSAVSGAPLQSLLFLECYAFFRVLLAAQSIHPGHARLAVGNSTQCGCRCRRRPGDSFSHAHPGDTAFSWRVRGLGRTRPRLSVDSVRPQRRSWSDLLSNTRVVQVPNQFVESQ